MSDITYAYVRKLHALACLIADAGRRLAWHGVTRAAPLPPLVALEVPDDVTRLDALASATGPPEARLRQLNPAFRTGRIVPGRDGPQQVLRTGNRRGRECHGGTGAATRHAGAGPAGRYGCCS